MKSDKQIRKEVREFWYEHTMWHLEKLGRKQFLDNIKLKNNYIIIKNGK